ncbi:hypothetical protein TWF730_005490 [Orbilia blumenaviensis]|uniref:Uncharacterized protein n=1 Tax=Orbilia blumenaviensis TaxID=1796055 RepID=A0AAV9VIR8_9PEZI
MITKGTQYTTVTETIPAGYGGYGYGTYGESQPSETASTYGLASYNQPTCTDYIVCPTCAIGYYCPDTLAPSPLGYYQQPIQSPTPTSTASLSPSFYPPPSCDNYVVCRDCFLGYYCPGPSQGTPTAKYPVKPYGSPPCDDYTLCPTCSLGYYCPSRSPSPTKYAPTTPPSYGTPICSDYIVCPNCPLGYYCPTDISTPKIYRPSTYNWASYEQPSCPDYVVCPTCPMGYYCPTPTSVTERPPKPYATPTCPDYIVCPSCPLGYYCPSKSPTSSRPLYYTKPNSNGYNFKTQSPYVTSITYYMSSPTTTLIAAPTCSEYVLCPVCSGGYYCRSNFSTKIASKSAYYYGSPDTSGTPALPIPSCDMYVFCPECELGYSCLIRTTPSIRKRPNAYKTGGTANPPMSNPYPGYTTRSGTPSIDGTYVTPPGAPEYKYASVPAPELPTCAGYVLCPTCPLGYYCASIFSPTAAPSTYYGVASTGVIEQAYSTTIISPPYYTQSNCPNTTKTVTVTTTRDFYRIYNICATDPYAILTSFIIPTATVTQCNPKTPPPYPQAALPTNPMYAP